MATENVLCEGETYTLAEFKRRAGLTDSAMRALRREGLHVDRIGKRAYVRAESFFELLRRRAESHTASRRI